MGALEHIKKRVVIEDRGHTSPCWIWTGPLDGRGYGRTSVPTIGPRVRIHRATYELCVAKIPDGLTIDHLCRVRACCNPAHLEAVTQYENSRRAGLYDLKSHCACGVELTEETRAGKRSKCRACHAAYMRAWNRDAVARGHARWRDIHREDYNAWRRTERALMKARG